MPLVKVQNVENEIMVRLKSLPQIKKQEILDFIGYLSAKSEWNATIEVRQDKKLLAHVKKGLKDIKNGKIERVRL